MSPLATPSLFAGSGGIPGSGGVAGAGGPTPPYCGDGKRNSASEACDGADLGGATCQSVLGNPHGQGILKCTQACAFDTSSCAIAPYCGDGVRNGSESCDGDDVGGATCATALGNPNATGILACKASCAFDTSGCIASKCGNATLDPGEECDASVARCQACKVVCLSGESKYGTHCYQQINTPLGWDQAEAWCESQGGGFGHLVTVTSSGENTFVTGTVLGPAAIQYDKAWIGLSDAAFEGNFVWVTGEALSYTNWRSGEPNDMNGNEDCAAYYLDLLLWNDDTCTKALKFVCEYEPAVK